MQTAFAFAVLTKRQNIPYVTIKKAEHITFTLTINNGLGE